jgi:hypothetical protein
MGEVDKGGEDDAYKLECAICQPYRSDKGLLTSSEESPMRPVTVDRWAPKILDGEGSLSSLESS